MKDTMIRTMGVIMAPIGVVILLLSLWMLPMQPQGSAEKMITQADIAIGCVLAVSGIIAFLWRKRQTNRVRNERTGGRYE